MYIFLEKHEGKWNYLYYSSSPISPRERTTQKCFFMKIYLGVHIRVEQKKCFFKLRCDSANMVSFVIKVNRTKFGYDQKMISGITRTLKFQFSQ